MPVPPQAGMPVPPTVALKPTCLSLAVLPWRLGVLAFNPNDLRRRRSRLLAEEVQQHLVRALGPGTFVVRGALRLEVLVIHVLREAGLVELGDELSAVERGGSDAGAFDH